MSASDDAKHHRAEAHRSRAGQLTLLIKSLLSPDDFSDDKFMSGMARLVQAEVEHLEAAAVASVLHRLEQRLAEVTVDGPARKALEQLLKGET